jgi:phage-related minor tail protein
VAELIVNVKTKVDTKELKAAGKRITKVLGTGLKVGGTVAGAALGAVGAAATVAAAETLSFAEDASAAMEQFRRETGSTEESLNDFTDSAKDLFATGVGEGIDDIAESMAIVQNTMQSGAKETENLTKRALAMRDVFDKDVGESIDAVKVLMDEFGLTSDQAFDFLAEGAKRGLDRNGDLLDSVREYGNLFADADATASEFFSILETGTAGGVLGTDKIADAFKEFQIRFIEGNDDLVSGLETLGINYDELKSDVESGSLTIADAFGIVTRSAGKVDTSLLKNREAVAKLGTQFEDLGIEAVAGVDIASTSLEDMAGSMDGVIEKNQTIGESTEILKRQLVVALEPAAKELMPLLAEGVAQVSEFLTAARPIFQGFASDLRDSLGPAMTIIGDSLSRIAQVFGIASEGASGMDAALVILKGTLGIVVTAIEAVAIASKFLADAFEIAKGLASQLTTISNLAGEALGGESGEGLFGRGGALNILGLQGGGVIPGSPNQAVPIIAHGGEEVANPAIGQSITIGDETFAVREASRLAKAINLMRQRDMQKLVDTVAANL